MAEKFIPKICGGNRIDVPDRECTDCEQLEKRMTTAEGKIEVLEECCEQSLKQHDILAGDNVSISYNQDGTVTINSSGGGGSGITKTDILTAMGYNEMIISMTDDNNETHTWQIMGVRVDQNANQSSNAQVQDTIQNSPSANATITKQEILDALGYTEFEMEMVDENDEIGTWRIVGEQIN